MIRLRLSSFGDDSGDLNLPILRQELGYEVRDILTDRGLDPKNFQVLLNGHRVEENLWDSTKIIESDSILIAPKLEGDNERKAIATIAFIAVTIYTGTAASAAFGQFAGALITAGVTVAGGYIILKTALRFTQ
jgi:hypothetical protein